jgi:uncharacterized protein (DUF305 family)
MSACSTAAAPRSASDAAPVPAAGEPAATATADLEALYWARVESTRARFTEADVNFMTGMIGHHAQALVMAALATTHGASRPVQTLAARIINAQQDEIDLMRQWLSDRGQPVPEVHISGTTLMVHGAGDHAMHMPGMLTQEQLLELDRARGADFDRLFLTYMIQHHRGAIAMVDELFATDGAGQDPSVFKFAADVHVDQVTEVARMERMLAALPVAPGAP